MCWVLGLAHNKYKWSPQDSRLTSREKKKIRHLWNLNGKMPYYSQRKKSLQPLGHRMMIFVFKLLTLPHGRRRDLSAQWYSEKEQILGLILWILSFSFLSAPKGAFGCLLGHRWQCCGRPVDGLLLQGPMEEAVHFWWEVLGSQWRLAV